MLMDRGGFGLLLHVMVTMMILTSPTGPCGFRIPALCRRIDLIHVVVREPAGLFGDASGLLHWAAAQESKAHEETPIVADAFVNGI